MKLVVTADLHLGNTKRSEIAAMLDKAVEVPNTDALVIAGDVGEGSDPFRTVLKMAREQFDTVLVLCGNHDLYVAPGYNNLDVTSQQLWDEILPGIIADTGCIDLERNVWRCGAAAVVGTIAWYDYSAAEKRLMMPDAWYEVHKRDLIADGWIDWPMTDKEFAAEVSKSFLRRLEVLEEDPSTEEIVVLTHDPIFECQMIRHPDDYDWSCRNAYFGNLTLGAEVLQFSKVRQVISGHTHNPADGKVLRKGMPTIRAVVIDSDYNRPGFLVVDAGFVGTDDAVE